MLREVFENLADFFQGKQKDTTSNVQRWADILKKIDIAQHLKNDFGPGWDFESYEVLDINPDELTYRHIRNFSNVLPSGDISVSLYATRDGKHVIRILKDIPTFDAGDREGDSWHELFLFQGEKPGEMDGVYATGGYRLAFLVCCKHMLHVPVEISRLPLAE